MVETIFVIEERAETTRDALSQAGFVVRAFDDGDAAFAQIASDPPALVVVDLELKIPRGPEVLRRLRRDPVTERVPVLALSERHDEIDRVLAFELGADDFLAKPYSERELVLRARAVLRRALPRPPEAPAKLILGTLEVDLTTRRARVADREVRLTPVEGRLLAELASHAGTVLRRDQLLGLVWADADAGLRTVDTHVRRLREKLGASATAIETVRGIGYRLRVDKPNGHAR
ncbi:MAG: response regulator transcription factor [Myxococcales bacterium]|nr:response regulator transcription factor [Myxococcales bacterium]